MTAENRLKKANASWIPLRMAPFLCRTSSSGVPIGDWDRFIALLMTAGARKVLFNPNKGTVRFNIGDAVSDFIEGHPLSLLKYFEQHRYFLRPPNCRDYYMTAPEIDVDFEIKNKNARRIAKIVYVCWRGMFKEFENAINSKKCIIMARPGMVQQGFEDISNTIKYARYWDWHEEIIKGPLDYTYFEVKAVIFDSDRRRPGRPSFPWEDIFRMADDLEVRNGKYRSLLRWAEAVRSSFDTSIMMPDAGTIRDKLSKRRNSKN